jgi:type I restriction enzyme R subunit
MVEAGYTAEGAKTILQKVTDYDKLRRAIMLRSGDSTDLKQYNAMMRQLLDQYVQAPKSNVLEKLDDFSFLDIIDANRTEDDPDGINTIIDGEKEVGGEPAAAETIASNVRKYIIRKRDANPDYYDKLSEKLNKLLEEMKQQTEEYKETLRKLVEMLREMRGSRKEYPSDINTDGKKALYDNLGEDETLALRTYLAIKENAEVGFRENPMRQRALKKAIEKVQGMPADKVEIVLNIVKNNDEF